jgi:hypothetical protein
VIQDPRSGIQDPISRLNNPGSATLQIITLLIRLLGQLLYRAVFFLDPDPLNYEALELNLTFRDKAVDTKVLC